ncbi:class I SAM-dependent methyltransferase [Pelagibacteraceae bacterium]|nr:class I SAM-dependent methyltransferase [Pelagibacteraceae bacterium]
MFGFQWKKFLFLQHDSFNKSNLTKNRLSSLICSKLKKLKNKNVLEVGCGSGRFSELFLKNKSKLHAVDASNSVFVNYNLNKVYSKNNFNIARANLFNLPYKNNSFDLVFCAGVIQHTGNSSKAIKILWSKVKKGGFLAFDHYLFTYRYYLGIEFIIRNLLKIFSIQKRYLIIKKINSFFFPLFWLIKNNYFLIRALKKIIPLGFAYNHEYKKMKYDIIKELSFLNTHDALSDDIKIFLKKEELLSIIEDLPNCRIVNCKFFRKGSNGAEFLLKKIK